ncbi:MAG TPA: ATP-binding protein [Stellaceae bacterium]|nr:ATP-binding protein [Stellaceae bacterium]
MTRPLADIRQAAAAIRRHGAVAALAIVAICALVGLASLILADRRAEAARAARDLVTLASDAAQDVLAQDQRLLDQLAAVATVDEPGGASPLLFAMAPTLAPGVREAAQFDPTGALLAHTPGRLDDATLAALGAAAAQAATARPGTRLLVTRAIFDDGRKRIVVGLARPYFAADGALGGVALIAIDRSAFAALDRLPGLPQGSGFDLLRADGTLLFGEAAVPGPAGSRHAGIGNFPLSLRYRRAATEALSAWRGAAPCLALAAVGLAAALALVALLALRQRTANREIARLAGLEATLRADAAAAAATADRSDEMSRTRSRFFNQVTHELRTPLNAILGFSEAIRQEMFGPVTNPRYLEYAGLIHDAGSHLLSLINDLLDNARIEAGKMEIVPIRVSAAALARSALDLVELLAEGRDIAIAAYGLSTCPDLNVDPRAMKQVLVNLLSNAIKYTPVGGRIDLRFVAHGDGGVAIEVSDTGIGMSAADIAHAFEPFGRAASDKARRQQGTGLGLSLSRALVRLHHGDVTLASRLDAGTTAMVCLPATAAFAGPRLLPAAKSAAAA